MSDERARLGLLARRAGYGPATLRAIAGATLPRHTAGARLDDRGVAAVAGAVEVLARAGVTDSQLPALIDHYRDRFGARWRARFWTAQLRIAGYRHRHPEHFGPAPTDLPFPLAADGQPVALMPQVVSPDLVPARRPAA